MYYCVCDGLYWRAITHDMNKFRLSNFIAYAQYFYLKNGKGKFVRDSSGYYDASQTGDDAFDRAWHYHQRTNSHHWQYWTMSKDDGTFRCLDMPINDIKEMLCDWRGAGRAQGINPTGGWEEVIEYYNKNRDKMHFTNDTRYQLERIMIDNCLETNVACNIKGWNK